jgi:hypothetical protein
VLPALAHSLSQLLRPICVYIPFLLDSVGGVDVLPRGVRIEQYDKNLLDPATPEHSTGISKQRTSLSHAQSLPHYNRYAEL